MGLSCVLLSFPSHPASFQHSNRHFGTLLIITITTLCKSVMLHEEQRILQQSYYSLFCATFLACSLALDIPPM